jgi:hypothetical protein
MGNDLSNSELAVLQRRWASQPHALEAKLLRAFMASNECWKCTAALNVEEHPHCVDCPEWQPGAEAERGNG